MKIIKSWRKSISLQVKNGEIIVKAPIFMLKNQINTFINKNKKWIDEQLKKYNSKKKITESEIFELKKKAKEYIPLQVSYISKQYGLKYNKIRITSAKTRWGSCSSQKNLNFSFYLIGAPKEVIKYVIIHELSHLKEMNHSRKFWQEVEKMMPDYKVHMNWLKQNGNKLIF